MCCRFYVILGVLSKQTVVMAVLHVSGGFIGEGAYGKGGKTPPSPALCMFGALAFCRLEVQTGGGKVQPPRKCRCSAS